MRWIRKHAKAGAFLAGAIVLALGIAVFLKTYRDLGPDSNPYAGSGADPSASSAATPPRGTANPAAKSLSAARRGTLPVQTIHPPEPGGIVIAGLPYHRLVMTASSSAAIPGVGYLAPTSPDHSHGVVHNPGRAWSLTTQVTGRPNYAFVFVQAGPTGAATTCRITVDGHVESTRTTNGPYGRQVCTG